MAVVSLNGGIKGGILFYLFHVVQVTIIIMYYYWVEESFIFNKDK